MEKKNNIIIGLLIAIIILLLCLLGYLTYAKFFTKESKPEQDNIEKTGVVKEFNSSGIFDREMNYIKKIYMLDNGEIYIEFYKEAEMDANYVEKNKDDFNIIKSLTGTYKFNFNGNEIIVQGYKLDSNIIFKDGYVLQHDNSGLFSNYLISKTGDLYVLCIKDINEYFFDQKAVELKKIDGITDVTNLVVKLTTGDYDYYTLYAIDSKGNEKEVIVEY